MKKTVYKGGAHWCACPAGSDFPYTDGEGDVWVSNNNYLTINFTCGQSCRSVVPLGIFLASKEEPVLYHKVKLTNKIKKFC